MDNRERHVGFLIMDIANGGGTERVTSVLANELVKRNYKVSIISCQGGQAAKFPLDKNIVLYSLHGEVKKISAFRRWSSFKMIKKYVCENRIDLMIAVDVALYLYLLPLQIMGKCKNIAWEHFNLSINTNRLARISRWFAAQTADCIVVLTDNDKKNYFEHFTNIKKLERIYNPITTQNKAKSGLKCKKVVAVGRLTEQKGFDILIEIWAKIENMVPEWELNIYGKGPLENDLKKRIQYLELERVNLGGYVENIEKVFLDASIFVLSSRYEGFVLVLLEALSKGLPCVCFNCKEGPSEVIIDGENGFLIENGNIDGFAQRLLLLMENQELLKSISENTEKGLEKFKPEVIFEEWVKLLDNLFEQ